MSAHSDEARASVCDLHDAKSISVVNGVTIVVTSHECEWR